MRPMRQPVSRDPGPRRRGSWAVTAVVWVTIVLMIVPSSLYSGPASDAGDQGNPVTRALWLLILGVSSVLVLNRGALTIKVARRLNGFLLLFVVLAGLSMVWSLDSSQTLRDMVRMVTFLVAALAVASVGWNPRRYQQLTRPVLTLMLIGSIGFGMLWPELAIHQEQNFELANAWHGLFDTKNALGTAASFTFILWAHAWLTRETGRLSAAVGMAAAAACLVLSRSSTSMITTILTLLTLLLLIRTPKAWRRAVPYLTAGLMSLVLLFSLAMLKVVPGLEILVAPIPAITGKDLTFSNRANIWAAVVDHVRYRPVLGSGYGGYWTMGTPTPDLESYAIKSQLEGFYPGSAHNGYLQVLNDLGAVGLCCLLAYLFVFVRDCLAVYRLDRTQGALFLSLILQQATVNLTEPLWLNVLLVDCLLMFMINACVARQLLEAQTRAVRSPATGRGAAIPPPTRRARELSQRSRLARP